MTLDRTAWLRLGVAAGVAVSGGIHLRLYRNGYRDIHLDHLAGVDLARSFALAVIAATVISVALVASVVWQRYARAVTVAALVYALSALAAYVLARTHGLLGFQESRWITEAVIAKAIEAGVVVLAALALAKSPADSSIEREQRREMRQSGPRGRSEQHVS